MTASLSSAVYSRLRSPGTETKYPAFDEVLHGRKVIRGAFIETMPRLRKSGEQGRKEHRGDLKDAGRDGIRSFPGTAAKRKWKRHGGKVRPGPPGWPWQIRRRNESVRPRLPDAAQRNSGFAGNYPEKKEQPKPAAPFFLFFLQFHE